MSRIAGLVLSLAWIPILDQSDAVVSDKERGFTLMLPKGFTRHPGTVGENPRIIHSFIRGNPHDNEPDVFLMIERMGGIIGRKRLNPQAMPPRSGSGKWSDSRAASRRLASPGPFWD